MTEATVVLCFALCVLAVWRVAHLLARESGPQNLIVRLRAALGSGFLGRVMDSFCFVSFLVALPPAIWLSSSRMGFLVQWLALSTVASLLERATQKQGRYIRVTPVSTSHMDEVISGV